MFYYASVVHTQEPARRCLSKPGNKHLLAVMASNYNGQAFRACVTMNLIEHCWQQRVTKGLASTRGNGHKHVVTGDKAFDSDFLVHTKLCVSHRFAAARMAILVGDSMILAILIARVSRDNHGGAHLNDAYEGTPECWRRSQKPGDSYQTFPLPRNVWPARLGQAPPLFSTFCRLCLTSGDLLPSEVHRQQPESSKI